jgi:hypothetical protein
LGTWSIRRWISIGIGVVVALLVVAGILVAAHWPFTRRGVVSALEHVFASTVDVQNFRVTYFSPGCVMEGVTFRRNSDGGVPPIARVDRVTIVGSYAGFFMFPRRISRVKVEGLHVFASAKSERAGEEVSAGGEASKNSVVVGEIIADGAVLEFASGQNGSAPTRFEIAKLAIDEAGDDRALAFHVVMNNPTPPGEIRGEGRLGPLKRDDVGQTAASGTYSFAHADLGVFSGIGGTLASTGKFGGVLEKLDVTGSTDVRDFEVDRSGKAVELKTQFAAVVNGMNGDVTLNTIRAEFGKTSVVARGEVASKPSGTGKTVSIAGTQAQGTIQDWLTLLAKAKKPAMTGAMNFRAEVRVPPGPRSFIERAELRGDFGIGSADFTKPDTQKSVDNLSEAALGGKQKDDPPSVDESMKGHVEMKNAVATLTDLYFGAPGTLAHMHGTYGILTEKIDLHGNLRVDHKLSKGASGMKAALLKVAEPFFKKKKQAEIVPIKMGGTFSQPTYGLDVIP